MTDWTSRLLVLLQQGMLRRVLAPLLRCLGRDYGLDLDLISDLPDDVLLQLLSRVGCARAHLHPLQPVVRSGLPEYTFKDMEPEVVEAALAKVTRPTLDRLDIDTPELKEAKLNFKISGDFHISFSAPKLERHHLHLKYVHFLDVGLHFLALYKLSYRLANGLRTLRLEIAVDSN